MMTSGHGPGAAIEGQTTMVSPPCFMQKCSAFRFQNLTIIFDHANYIFQTAICLIHVIFSKLQMGGQILHVKQWLSCFSPAMLFGFIPTKSCHQQGALNSFKLFFKD